MTVTTEGTFLPRTCGILNHKREKLLNYHFAIIQISNQRKSTSKNYLEAINLVHQGLWI